MENIKKYFILGSADYTGKYEAMNYWQHERQSVRVKKCTCFWNWTIAVLH